MIKFPPGEIAATPSAMRALEDSGQEPCFFLDKHLSGDWGSVCEEDAAANEESLANGSRILSAYHTLRGVCIWVITEADRSVTTILLPSEY